MFVLNFVLFFNLFTLETIFHHIVDACVEVCFLKKQFLNLNINMQLLYFITLHAQREWGKVISCGVHIYIYIYLLHTSPAHCTFFNDA